MTTRLSVFRPNMAVSRFVRQLCFVSVAAVVVIAVGCTTSKPNSGAAGSSSTNSSSTTKTTSTSGEAEKPARQPITSLEELDERYGIGPLTAQKLNYHIDWRVDTLAPNAKLLTAQNDSVYVLDTSNFLSRYRATDGARMWRAPVASTIEEILGITDVPDAERVYVTTGGSLFELDRSSGGQVGRQKFEKIPNTPPAHVGQFIVYGARNGQVIWHSYPVEYQWKATQLAQSINVEPVFGDGYIAAVGNDGEFMVLDAAEARRIWSTKLLDEAVAPPVIGGGVVYVAALDQHLRAYDVRNGRLLWKVLTRSPLNMSPSLIDQNVYQQVPGEGLVCFDALPIDSPGGKEIWRAKEVTGGIITRHGRNLITWDPNRRVMQVLDATYGSLTNTFNMSPVRRLFTTDIQDGTMYLLTDGGTLSRVAPAP